MLLRSRCPTLFGYLGTVCGCAHGRVATFLPPSGGARLLILSSWHSLMLLSMPTKKHVCFTLITWEASSSSHSCPHSWPKPWQPLHYFPSKTNVKMSPPFSHYSQFLPTPALFAFSWVPLISESHFISFAHPTASLTASLTASISWCVTLNWALSFSIIHCLFIALNTSSTVPLAAPFLVKIGFLQLWPMWTH